MRSIPGWTAELGARDATRMPRPCANGRRSIASHRSAERSSTSRPPGLPDLVFTANAAVVLDRQVLLARFRHPERAREEPHFEAVFRSLQARGLVDAVRKLPESVVLEGADCVWDATRELFWLGYGQCS
jgi:N-dimethylarginine dimethylaminohydrolase